MHGTNLVYWLDFAAVPKIIHAVRVLVFSASSNAAAESCKEGFLEIKYGSSTVIINVEIAILQKKGIWV